jgi:signal transduction histidine kinase
MGWWLCICGGFAVAVNKIWKKFVPVSMTAQMISVFALSLSLLLGSFVVQEVLKHETPLESASSGHTLDKLSALLLMLATIETEKQQEFSRYISSCHSGYIISDEPLATFAQSVPAQSVPMEQLKAKLARDYQRELSQVIVTNAVFSRDDFSFSLCREEEIDLPAEGIVISLQLPAGNWLNAEIHPHEWHFRDLLDWLFWSGLAFVFIGLFGVYFVRRISRPLDNLTQAALQFGEGMESEKLDETGPPDLERALRAFNTMRSQVRAEFEQRTNTLAAIGHDIRSPLTALRLKAELVEDEETRNDLISSVNKMEQITSSALQFLKADAGAEKIVKVDLVALISSECAEFSDRGEDVCFEGEENLLYLCRPEALASAVRNLLGNAVKYAGHARVLLERQPHQISIRVIDHGEGIPLHRVEESMEPFKRLSSARESKQGGFGLGLSIVKAVAKIHEGSLVLSSNSPTGLVAQIILPL